MNEIKHIWSVLCSNSSIDQTTNNVSLFNVIEQIELTKKSGSEFNEDVEKGIGINLELITLWQKTGRQTSFEHFVEFVDPIGKVLNEIKFPFNFPEKVKRFRANLKIQGLKITKGGEYNFRISVKEESQTKFTKIHELPLLIEVK